jgi:hypothetical protein
VLARFRGGGGSSSSAGGLAPGESASLAPLVAAVLRALASDRAFPEARFRAMLFSASAAEAGAGAGGGGDGGKDNSGGLYGALVSLLRVEHTTPEVQRALSDLLLARVGPLVVQGCGGAGGGAAGGGGEEGGAMAMAASASSPRRGAVVAAAAAAGASQTAASSPLVVAAADGMLIEEEELKI